MGNSAFLSKKINTELDRLEEVTNIPQMDTSTDKLETSHYDITLDHVSFGYDKRQVIHDISLNIPEHTTCAIVGPSGSGKTTLLNILASLDKPTSGEVLLDGKDLTKISDKHISAFRRDNLGFVFQDFNLLDTFNVADNIYLPLVLSKEPYALMKPKLEKLARPLGINHLLEKYPYEISGGQKQRVAVARALITHPKIILADEPTGALDSKSTDQLLSIFDQIHQSGQTILMVTHSSKAASYASRVLFIKDGQIFHQLYKGDMSNQEMYQAISDTLTMLLSGGQ